MVALRITSGTIMLPRMRFLVIKTKLLIDRLTSGNVTVVNLSDEIT